MHPPYYKYNEKNRVLLADDDVQASFLLLALMGHDQVIPRIKLNMKQSTEEFIHSVNPAQRSTLKEIDDRVRVRNMANELTMDHLREHFHKPIVEVAQSFGICTTLLKKICRRLGIKRWPHRQIRSLTKSINTLLEAKKIAIGEDEKQKLNGQIESLMKKKNSVMTNPNDAGRLANKTKVNNINNQENIPSKLNDDCRNTANQASTLTTVNQHNAVYSTINNEYASNNDNPIPVKSLLCQE